MNEDNVLSPELHKQAINAAITCNWQTAIDINQKLLEEDPQNTEVLNRLAKAHFEIGSYSQARKIYIKVLEIDPYNTIAEKNLKKAASLKKDGQGSGSASMALSPAMFLEEPGVTTLVNLVKIAEPQKLLRLSPGTVVNLVEKKRGVSVTDFQGIYLGAFPDDSAFHLLKLLKGGNKYVAIIKSVRPPSGLTVLVRETLRSKKFKNQASFLDESRIVAFSSENISLMERRSDDNDDSGQSSEDIVT